MGTLTETECREKISYYTRLKNSYNNQIGTYNTEKHHLLMVISDLNDVQGKLDRLAEQFSVCHQISCNRVNNTSGLANINSKMVNALVVWMNDLINGWEYQKSIRGISSQYSEIEYRRQSKHSRINMLDVYIGDYNNKIANCDYWISYYEQKIKEINNS